MKIRLDIDDTILYSKIDENGDYYLVGYNDKLIDKINDLHDKGVEIIVDTGRHWDHLKTTLEQLEKIGLKYHSLNMGKPHCDYIIDDKAILPEDFLKVKI